MRAELGGFCRGNLLLFDRAVAGNFTAADFLLERNTLVGDDALLRNARALGGLARGDLGLFQVALPLDLETPILLVLGDARAGHGQLLRDARLFGLFAGRDFGVLDVALALDFAPLVVLFAGDARFGDDALLGDARALDPLAGGDLGLVDLAAAVDLAFADLALRCNARFGDRALVGDARLLDFFARGDLCLFRFGVAQRAFAGEFGALHCAPYFDVALLIEPRGLALAIDFEGLLLGLEIAAANENHRILFDVVAQLAPRLDVFDELGQTFGVEAVRRVKKLEAGLVKIGDRHRFELKPVPLQALQCGFRDPGDVFAALLMHLHHSHFGGDRAQCGNELAGQQRVELGDVHGAAAERRRGDGHRLARRWHPHIKLGFDVDAHAVLGDQRVVAVAHHLHAQHVHVDRRDLVDERKHESAGVDDDLFAEQAGPHEGNLLRRAVVEPVDEIDDDRDDDDRDDQPDDQTAENGDRHLTSSPPADR